MEKEDAEKAITELDDSVTSKEDASLAEKNEKTNGVEAETPVSPVDAGEPSEAIKNKDEKLPEKAESEQQEEIPSEDSAEVKSAPEAAIGEEDKAIVAPADEETTESREAAKGKEDPLPDDEPVINIDTDVVEESAKPKETATEEKKVDSEQKEEVSSEDSAEVKSAHEATIGKEDKAIEAPADEETTEPREAAKGKEDPLPDDEPVINMVNDVVEETAKPKETATEEKKTESEQKEEISSEDSAKVKSAPEAAIGENDKAIEAPSDEETTGPREAVKGKEDPLPDDEPGINMVTDIVEESAKPKETATEEKNAESEQQEISSEDSAEVKSAPEAAIGKEDKAIEAPADEETTDSREATKGKADPLPDDEPVINIVTDVVEESAKPRETATEEKKTELEQQEEISSEDSAEVKSAPEAAIGEEDKAIEAPADEETTESMEAIKGKEDLPPDDEPGINMVTDVVEETAKPKETATEGKTPESEEQAKTDDVPAKTEEPAENIEPEATEPADKPELKDTPKEKGKKKDPKKSANDNKAIAEQPVAAEHHDEYQNADFTTYSKEELVEVIKNLGKDENPFLADRILKNIAPLFNKMRSEEREVALKNFIKDGGEEGDFQYKPDELSLRFDANYKLIKDKKTKKFKEQDIQRGKNLILAEEVLNELRDFVDSEESSGSFNSFKAIQQKWKDIGDVPSQNSRTLWANYNALVHRFYDQRSIYFELKELDRKKNYESKLKLCDKAEALVDEENLRDAIKSLNDLHHEFKHLGPVPLEVQEELWQRFKAASDKVYERRKAFVHELKAELHENLIKKQELIEKIKLFIEFQSDRIKEWNEKTKELIALQNTWEKIGGLPKEKAKLINKEFWSSFKKFFSNKHLFFKKLDADRDEHLVKKQALLAQANALKDSEEWDKTANELKNLQSQWREIGPVPEKMRKKLYDEFKACCDYFFENRRVGAKNSHEDYKVNLKKKKKVIEDIIKLKKDADKNLDKFNELRKEFLEMGYVPKKNITSIKEEFQNAIESYLKDLTILNVKQKTEISLEAEFASLAGAEHSETELYHKEQSVRRQINKLEDDIALWQNNLEFFAHSKSTDKLREEVNKKIDDAAVHVESLKRQLKMLRTL